MFKEKLPTGIEIIYNVELNNLILIAIPKTQYHILGEKKHNGNWNIGIINRLGCYKRKIGEDILESDFTVLINLILNNQNQESYKFKITINQLKEKYKLLLTQIKLRHEC